MDTQTKREDKLFAGLQSFSMNTKITLNVWKLARSPVYGSSCSADWRAYCAYMRLVYCSLCYMLSERAYDAPIVFAY